MVLMIIIRCGSFLEWFVPFFLSLLLIEKGCVGGAKVMEKHTRFDDWIGPHPSNLISYVDVSIGC